MSWKDWNGKATEPPTIAEMLEGARTNLLAAEREERQLGGLLERLAPDEDLHKKTRARLEAIKAEKLHWREYVKHWERQLAPAAIEARP